MDSRMVGQGIRRRVGAPMDVYDEAHRTEDAKLLAQERDRQVAEGNTGPNGTLPRLRGGHEERFGRRTMVHRSIPMGTDYVAIEDAFDDRRALAKIRHEQETGGGMD